MQKYFSTALLFLVFYNAQTQTITYSHPLSRGLSNTYIIIGQVKNNIVTWNFNERKQSSEIFIYDNKMNLIKTVMSDILKSALISNVQFINSNNSFFVAYQYYSNQKLIYKLSKFDELGNLFSSITLDSVDINKGAVDSSNYYYRIFQTNDKQTICFARIAYDVNNYLLKFNLNFIDAKGSVQNNFILPLNDIHETLSDILIDNEKNLLLLTCNKSDSANSFRLIKKSLLNAYTLISEKKLDSGFTGNQLLHLSKTKNGYLVFGDWYNSRKNVFENGTFAWQTDSSLNDFTGDSIINITTGDKDIFTNTVNIPLENTSIYFAKWSYFPLNKKAPLSKHEASLIPANPVFSEQPLDDNASLPLPGTGMSDHLIHNYSNYSTVGNDFLPPYSPDYYKGTAVPQNMQSVLGAFNQHPKLELFGLSKNKIEWTNNFTSGIDSNASVDLSEAKILAGVNAIHIIYKIASKNNISLSHIIIQPDGSYKKNELINWQLSYKYLLDESVFTKQQLIIPCTKGNKIKFAKLSLE